jgi:hypothetical protein
MTAPIPASGSPALAGPGTCLLAASPREKPRAAEIRRRKETLKNAGLLCLSGEAPPENAKGLADKTPQKERRETRIKKTLKNRALPRGEKNMRGEA